MMRIGTQKDFRVASADIGPDGKLHPVVADYMVEYITGVIALAVSGAKGKEVNLQVTLETAQVEAD